MVESCKRREWKGYMTIEASFIVPFMIIVIIFTIYMGFYLYNVCLLGQVAYTAALRGSQLREGSNEQVKEYTCRQVDDLLTERLVAVQDMHKNVEVTMGKVSVSVSMTVYMPFGDWVSADIGLWTFEREAVVKRIDPVSMIRAIRLIK